jgi:hypothetical protein
MSVSSTSRFSLDADSVTKIVGPDTNQIMVYGFGDSHYCEIISALQNKLLPNISHVYDHLLGRRMYPKKAERSIFEYILNLPNEPCRRTCKGAIVLLVLKNYKREKRGLPLIPLLFCVDATEISAEHKLTPESLTSKDPEKNDLYTHGELRRVYKLCKEFEGYSQPALQTVSRIAKQTFHPVKVERQESGTYRLVPVAAVWDQPEWKAAWDARMQSTPPLQRFKERLEKPAEWQWRRLVLERTKLFDSTFVP